MNCTISISDNCQFATQLLSNKKPLLITTGKNGDTIQRARNNLNSYGILPVPVATQSKA